MAEDSATRVSETPAEENAPKATSAEVDASDAAPVEGTADEPEATNGTSDDPKDTNEADEAKQNGDTVAADDVTTDATPASKKKEKRKSTGAVPEHKGKKLNRKKSMATLHLDVEPGQFWFVQMKGYPPWPAVICDDEMLPASLLSSRPVSAKNADGRYRADFEEGGKNVRDRRYPVMFLGTNEFAWHVNTDLDPLDMDQVKDMVKNEERGKRTKQLWDAYVVASEDHDLDHFKQMLIDHETNKREEEEELAAKEAEKAEKAEKAAKATKTSKRKSIVKADEDVEMEDAEEPAKAPKSASKKRKKEADADGEGDKPSKTPKKLKVNLKEPKETKEATEEQSTKKKTPKEKKEKKPAKAKAENTAEDLEKKREKMEKMVLYLRHKLQKGFLAREQKPQEDEMDSMSDQLKQLEALDDIDAQTIRKTKINKVLKAILKLNEIPKESEYNFKDRANALLNKMAPILGLEADNGKTENAPTTNGVDHDEDADKPEKPAESPAASKPTEASSEAADEEKKADDNPVDEKPATEEAAVAA